MAFLKKKISAHDLGNVIYSNIRHEVMSEDSPLFHANLIEKLEENADRLPPIYILELLIGSLFGAMLYIETKYKYPKYVLIIDSMKEAFLVV